MANNLTGPAWPWHYSAQCYTDVGIFKAFKDILKRYCNFKSSLCHLNHSLSLSSYLGCHAPFSDFLWAFSLGLSPVLLLILVLGSSDLWVWRIGSILWAGWILVFFFLLFLLYFYVDVPKSVCLFGLCIWMADFKVIVLKFFFFLFLLSSYFCKSPSQSSFSSSGSDHSGWFGDK